MNLKKKKKMPSVVYPQTEESSLNFIYLEGKKKHIQAISERDGRVVSARWLGCIR